MNRNSTYYAKYHDSNQQPPRRMEFVGDMDAVKEFRASHQDVRITDEWDDRYCYKCGAYMDVVDAEWGSTMKCIECKGE